MSAKYLAMTIAKWFIAWAEAGDAEIANLKLQKLLYYAQGHYLATYGRPLFDEPIQAWSGGPVVKNVYHEFKNFDRSTIELAPDDNFAWDEVDDETADFLIKVWNTYGPIAAWKLRDMTHDSGPWKRHFVPDAQYTAIPQSEILDYFASLERVAS